MDILYSIFGSILLFIFNFVQNYGVAVILFTLLVKFILLPVNLKQTRSMKEMQALQPEIAKLQKKYKNNKEKLNEETMKLYKIYKVNPMAGCLPLLLQMPILIGLFNVLKEPLKWVFTDGNASAVSQPFLWLPTLSDPDPIYILPILCAVLTFLTQKFTMSVQGNADPAQASTQKTMLYMMPLMIGFFAFSMPAGVALYWVVQNIFTFAQQIISMRKPLAKVSVEEAERRLQEAKKEKIKETKETRRQQSEMRENSMMAQQGKDNSNKKEFKRPKTKPASSKITKSDSASNANKNRKTITKIPTRDK